MMLNTISPEAWERVRLRFPEAWAYLVHESLKGELRSLQMEPKPNDWQKARLKELTELFATQYELAKAVSSDRTVYPLNHHIKGENHEQ